MRSWAPIVARFNAGRTGGSTPAAAEKEADWAVGLRGEKAARDDHAAPEQLDAEAPQQPREHEHRLGQRELRADAHARPGAEGHVGVTLRRRRAGQETGQ